MLNASPSDALAVQVVDDHDIVRRGITSTLAVHPRAALHRRGRQRRGSAATRPLAAAGPRADGPANAGDGRPRGGTAHPHVAKRDLALLLQGPPAMAAQPQSQTVYAGALARFSVAASGPPPLAYQWRLNCTNLLAATNASLTINPATTNHAGDYVVVVTNAFGSVTSAVATLTVIVPPPNARLIPLWPN